MKLTLSLHTDSLVTSGVLTSVLPPFTWTPVLTAAAGGAMTESPAGTFTKTAGIDAWDASVHDATLRSGNFEVQFKIPVLNGFKVGFNSNPGLSSGEADAGLNAAWFFAGGEIFYDKDGADIFTQIGTHIAGATYAVQRVGSNMVIKQNGNTLLNIATALATAPAAFDSSFNNVGGSIQITRYGPL